MIGIDKRQDPPEGVESALRTAWGLRQTRLQPIPSGYVNSNHIVHTGGEQFVLRVSWPGKSRAQLRREAFVLDGLGGHPSLPAVPRLRPTLHGSTGVRGRDGRWLHLFEWIAGCPGPPRDRAPGTCRALQALARLHAALATLPAGRASAAGWLMQRHRRVSRRQPPPMSEPLAAGYAPLLNGIGRYLSAAAARIPGPVQWLHGDCHPGNLLFVGERVSGIVDFDDVGRGARLLELAFALFAFSRNIALEDRFEFDDALWDRGLDAYAGEASGIGLEWLRRERDTLLPLFCADQVLIHLEAAQRGLWALTPGIGFLGCWNQLRNQPPANALAEVSA